MTLNRQILTTCGILFFVSQILFLINIQFPRGQNFDEFHYVPSAKQFLELKTNQNWEHPPFGKLIMAVGIAIGGDRPFGWRLMSTTFGALTLVGMFLWCLALFRDERLALWCAAITFFNQLLYVQARIGMLDTFMMAFIVWGLAAFCAAWDPKLEPRQTRPLLIFTGAMLGFGTACKWFTVVPWAAIIGLVSGVKLFQIWGTGFNKPKEDDWFHPRLFHGIRVNQWLRYLVVYPLVLYFLTFIPLYLVHGNDLGFMDLFEMQEKMWDGQQRVVTSHNYMSQWFQWPTLIRPIWYAFEREGNAQEYVRGVLLIGNPLVMLGGLLALIACADAWISRRNRQAFLIIFFFSVLYFSWAVIPRKISFYYYYYPAGMTLSLALAYVFHHLERGPLFRFHWARWAFLSGTVALFVYFFPILAALRIPANEFRKWMWSTGWI